MLHHKAPKVTVYILAYNYGKYIDKAIQSVLSQTMEDWELIVINDGSTDNTANVLENYKDHPKIRIRDQENKGLNVSSNIALRLANGKYIMRLDGDDYLDENALMVLANILDVKPEVGLVYPDYYHINEEGEVIELVRRKKIGQEVELLDLPAHGACTMFRKDLLTQIGGYLEEFSCQDGYEIWLRFVQKYEPYNVNVPLFYYRRHSESLTQEQGKILETRRKIKRRFVEHNLANATPKVLGIVPAVGRSIYKQSDPFIDIAGKPLIWYTLNELQYCKSLDRIVLSSEDDDVLNYASQFPYVVPMKRLPEFAKSTVKMQDLIWHVLDHLKQSSDYEPDAVCTLYINTPLRRAHHIDKAVDTMAIFDVDSVVSVQEELAHCYHHRRFGLEPINAARDMKVERKSIYKENSAIYLIKLDVIRQGRFIGKKVGHIIMLPEESVKINNEFELWLARNIISGWKRE